MYKTISWLPNKLVQSLPTLPFSFIIIYFYYIIIIMIIIVIIIIIIIIIKNHILRPNGGIVIVIGRARSPFIPTPGFLIEGLL